MSEIAMGWELMRFGIIGMFLILLIFYIAIRLLARFGK